MPDLRIKCPYCEERLDAPQELIGQDAECPTCGKSFKLHTPQTVQEHAANAKTLPKKQIFISHQQRTLVPQPDTIKQYEGINRGAFWFIMFGISALTYAGMAGMNWFVEHNVDVIAFQNNNLDPAGRFFSSILILILPLTLILWVIYVVVWAHERRMLSIMGSKGAWGLLVFIPVINVGVLFMCLFLPKGWKDTRRLDIKTWFLVLLAAFLCIGFYRFVQG